MISAFGVDHGTISKRSRSTKRGAQTGLVVGGAAGAGAGGAAGYGTARVVNRTGKRIAQGISTTGHHVDPSKLRVGMRGKAGLISGGAAFGAVTAGSAGALGGAIIGRKHRREDNLK